MFQIPLCAVDLVFTILYTALKSRPMKANTLNNDNKSRIERSCARSTDFLIEAIEKNITYNLRNVTKLWVNCNESFPEDELIPGSLILMNHYEGCSIETVVNQAKDKGSSGIVFFSDRLSPFKNIPSNFKIIVFPSVVAFKRPNIMSLGENVTVGSQFGYIDKIDLLETIMLFALSMLIFGFAVIIRDCVDHRDVIPIITLNVLDVNLLTVLCTSSATIARLFFPQFYLYMDLGFFCIVSTISMEKILSQIIFTARGYSVNNIICPCVTFTFSAIRWFNFTGSFALAVSWTFYRHTPNAWITQDILVIFISIDALCNTSFRNARTCLKMHNSFLGIIGVLLICLLNTGTFGGLQLNTYPAEESPWTLKFPLLLLEETGNYPQCFLNYKCFDIILPGTLFIMMLLCDMNAMKENRNVLGFCIIAIFCYMFAVITVVILDLFICNIPKYGVVYLLCILYIQVMLPIVGFLTTDSDSFWKFYETEVPL